MVDLNPGDLVCAHRASLLGELIADVEERDPCSDPFYGHAFIVTGEKGQILNTLGKVVVGDIYRDYTGIDLLIGRSKCGDPQRIHDAITEVLKDIGDDYPAWRLVADAAGLGRSIHTSSKVCSERAVYFGYKAFGFEPFKNWAGWTPGNLAFVLKYSRAFQVIFEGKI